MSSGRASRPLSGALILLLLISMGTAGVAVADDADSFWGKVLHGDLGVVTDLSKTAICAGSIAGGLPILSALEIGYNCYPDLFGGIGDSVDPDVQHSSLYVEAAEAQDAREQSITELQSRLNQTYGIGMARAKITIIEAMNNGTAQEEALQQALNQVQDFYSRQQLAMLNRLNREVIGWNATVHTLLSDGSTGVALDTVVNATLCSKDGTTVSEQPIFTERNVTLLNGSQATQYGFKWYDARPHEETALCSSVSPLTQIVVPPTLSSTTPGQDVAVTDPTGDQTPADRLNGPRYDQLWTAINQTYQRAADNIVGFSQDIYSQYEAGEITVAQSLGPLEATITAATKYEQTGYYAYRALSLAQMGRATNSSYAFTVQWSQAGTNTTHTDTGQLFTTTDRTLRVNKTYDASNMTAWFVHGTEDGAAVTTPFNGTYTIQSMIDKSSGEPVNTTTVQDTRFYTASVQDLKEQLDRRNQLLDRFAERPTLAGIIESGQLFSWLDGILGQYLPSWATNPAVLAAGGLVLGYAALQVLTP